MPGVGVRTGGLPLLAGALALVALATGVVAAGPDLRASAVTATEGRPAVLLDHAHDAQRGDAVHTLRGTLAYLDGPKCFVLLGPGRLTLPANSYTPRPVVWPADSRGVRDGDRVGVRLSTGQQIWAGQNIEAFGTPVADGGKVQLPASVAKCRSDEYVVLERIQAIEVPPRSLNDSGYELGGVPVLDAGLLWTDAEGRTLPRSRIFAEPGDGWCNWEAITYLDVMWGQGEHAVEGGYVRDPFGMLADRERVPFDAHATLPADARPTGWKQRDVALWLADDAAYLVLGNRTERWSRLTRPMGCA